MDDMRGRAHLVPVVRVRVEVGAAEGGGLFLHGVLLGFVSLLLLFLLLLS